MRYYKTTSDGYIIMISRQIGRTEITAEEYADIEAALANKPEPKEGYALMLRDTLEWEYIEQPAPEPEDEDAEPTDYESALAEFGVMSHD